MRNQSHFVVVETPEALLLQEKMDDLKQRLEIKIRCPFNILQHNILPLINGKLDLRIALLFYDGSQTLQDVKNQKIPTVKFKQA